MSCPTCDHTMQNLPRQHPINGWFWCPRCGTIKSESSGEVATPKLVERCVEFAKTITDGPWDGEDVRGEFERLGILESILRPEMRELLKSKHLSKLIGENARLHNESE